MNVEKLIAVIVLYNSSLENSLTFQTLLKTVEYETHRLTLVVYNNSPSYWHYTKNKYGNLDIIYIEDNLNSGVSTAYNKTFHLACDNNKDFLLLLDQDTQLPVNFFTELFYSWQIYRNININLLAPLISNDKKLLSPSKFMLHTSRSINISAGIHKIDGLAIINSGLIISKELFQRVGGYNERIKLDFSDFDFFKRCLKFCDSIIIFNASCKHSLSSEEEISLDKALVRFKFYLQGARNMQNSLCNSITLNIWTFFRSIRLGLKYRSFDFTMLYFNTV